MRNKIKIYKFACEVQLQASKVYSFCCADGQNAERSLELLMRHVRPNLNREIHPDGYVTKKKIFPI